MTTLQHIASLAAQAGEIILHNTQAPVHRKEGHYNFVTDADTAVQTFLTKRLRDVLPAARFFCEEQENDALGNEPTFIIDPIDGTCNFMRGRGCSAVSIALTEGRRPVLGVVCNPYRGETFTAELGKGTQLNGQPVRVSDMSFENALVAMGTSPYYSELAEKTFRAAALFQHRAGDLRRTGSAAIDFADVCCGRADVFFEYRLSPWDFTAGALLVQEAGGVFCAFDRPGQPPDYGRPSPTLACNPRCAEEALRILSAV